VNISLIFPKLKLRIRLFLRINPGSSQLTKLFLREFAYIPKQKHVKTKMIRK